MSTDMDTRQGVGALQGAARERANFYKLIWLFPAAYALHITEESLGFPRWVTQVLHGQMDVRLFYINNAGFMIILLALYGPWTLHCGISLYSNISLSDLSCNP